MRVHSERHARPRWDFVVEEDNKLQESDIDAFVDGLLPLGLNLMYTAGYCEFAENIIRVLCALRPAKVVDPVLEGLYSALDTLTEPHKLIGTLTVARVIPRAVVKERPTEVIPLMLAVLPGIDLNDVPKLKVICGFITSFCGVVLIVDTTESLLIHGEALTEEERTVCSQSSQFLDFVLEFVQRVFAVAEASTYTNTLQEVNAVPVFQS